MISGMVRRGGHHGAKLLRGRRRSANTSNSALIIKNRNVFICHDSHGILTHQMSKFPPVDYYVGSTP